MPWQLSRPVRLAVRSALAANFNGLLAGYCAAYGVLPFTIDFTGVLVINYFDGPIILETLLDYLEENPSSIPAMCLYASDTSSQGFVRPSDFSGQVRIGGAVFLRYPLDTLDYEPLGEAVQSAIAEIIHGSQDDHWGGGMYRDDLAFRSTDLSIHNGAFYRAVEFQMSFQI